MPAGQAYLIGTGMPADRSGTYTEAMEREELDELGEKLTRSEERAPTRPHPHAPKEQGRR